MARDGEARCRSPSRGGAARAPGRSVAGRRYGVTMYSSSASSVSNAIVSGSSHARTSTKPSRSSRSVVSTDAREVEAGARSRCPRRGRPRSSPWRCPRRRTGPRAGHRSAATPARPSKSRSWSRTQWNVAVDRTASTWPSTGSGGAARSACTYADPVTEASQPPRGLGEHRRRSVERDDPAARQALEELLGQAARAAAGVEDALVAMQLQPIEGRCAHGRVRRRDPVV